MHKRLILRPYSNFNLSGRQATRSGRQVLGRNGFCQVLATLVDPARGLTTHGSATGEIAFVLLTELALELAFFTLFGDVESGEVRPIFDIKCC